MKTVVLTAAAIVASATSATALTFTEIYAEPDAAPVRMNIAVARFELGRVTPMPWSEVGRWDHLTKRTGHVFEPLRPGAMLDVVPEIAFDGTDTDNKIDEARLAALDEGYAHLLIYGLGEDARAGGFARRSVAQTGLQPDAAIAQAGASKAILLDARTGRVLGAVVEDDVEFGIGVLTDRIAEMVTD